MPLIGHCSPRLPEETVTRLQLLILAAVTQLTRQVAPKPPSKLSFPAALLWQGGAASVPFGFPAIVDLDETTHTLYVPDANEGPIYILDTSTCNGSTPTCSSPIVTATNG